MSQSNPGEKRAGAGSKFSGLLAAVKEREAATGGEAGGTIKDTPPAPAVGPQRGRPRGKRSDPNFEQVTAYIGRNTHRDVKIALLTEGRGREFSELVEELLREWLLSQK